MELLASMIQVRGRQHDGKDPPSDDPTIRMGFRLVGAIVITISVTAGWWHDDAGRRRRISFVVVVVFRIMVAGAVAQHDR
jgi:hypothetical protein